MAGGAASPSEAINAYLAALDSRDPAALQRVAPPEFDVDAAAQEKLRKYAGMRTSELQAQFTTSSITTNLVTARISSATPGFEDVVEVQRIGGRWFVLLGRARGSTPGPTTGTRGP